MVYNNITKKNIAKKFILFIIISSIIVETIVLYFIINKIFTTALIGPTKYTFYESIFMKLWFF